MRQAKRSIQPGDGESVQESSEGKRVLQSEDRVRVARNERRGHFIGAMEQGSRKRQMGSTHSNGGIRVHQRARHRHSTTRDVESSTLRASEQQSFQWGVEMEQGHSRRQNTHMLPIEHRK